MRNVPKERSRSGFVPVTQDDNDGYDDDTRVDNNGYDSDRTEQRQFSQRQDFRARVRQALYQDSVATPQIGYLLTANGSPALSDTTLSGEDYLSLPRQQFDDVDLTDTRDEYAMHHGLEAVGNGVFGSEARTRGVGEGIEVRTGIYPTALSPGGLHVNDRVRDTSYQGSRGVVEKALPVPFEAYTYKPVPLRWWYILMIFGSLIAFLTISELALRLLPDASTAHVTLPKSQNISEIRRRSGFHGGTKGHVTLPRFQNISETRRRSGFHGGAKGHEQNFTLTPSDGDAQPTLPVETDPNTDTSTSKESSTSKKTSTSTTSTSTTSTLIKGTAVTTTGTSKSTGAIDISTPTIGNSTSIITTNTTTLHATTSPETSSSTKNNAYPTPIDIEHGGHPDPGEISPPPANATSKAASTESNEDSSKQSPIGNPFGDPVTIDPETKPPLLIKPSPEPDKDNPTDQSGDQSAIQDGGPLPDRYMEPSETVIGNSSPTAIKGSPMMASGQIVSIDGAAGTPDDGRADTLRDTTTQVKVTQIKAPDATTQLLGHPQLNVGSTNKPFTTLYQMNTETPPPITTVLTTSSISSGVFVEVTMTTIIPGHIKAADRLTEWITTETDQYGRVHTTTKQVYDDISIVTQVDANGKPIGVTYIHVLKSARLTTLTDGFGYPTATLDFIDVQSTLTLYDSNKSPTATITTVVPERTVRTTLYDGNNIATGTDIILQPLFTSTSTTTVPTPTLSPGSNDQRALELKLMPDIIYFAGIMLPTLVAILISIPVRILGRNVKLYQGFHLLASKDGATAEGSLCLNTTGPASLFSGLRGFQRGDYLLGLTSALVVVSLLTVPFSTEVVRLVLQGPRCNAAETDELRCTVSLGVFPAPAHVLSALLVFLAAGIILVAFLLRKWKSGVERNPWSISQMTQLGAGTDMRRVLQQFIYPGPRKKIGTKEFIRKFGRKPLYLDHWEDNTIMKYSVLFSTPETDEEADKSSTQIGRSVAFAKHRRGRKHSFWPSGDLVSFFMLSLLGRILFLLSLSGLIIAVLVYDIVARGSEFRRGLTGKALGLRFLFSGAGVLMTIAWGSFFNAVAFLSPYRLLERKRLNNGAAIHLNPATNPFTGLWLAFTPSRRDIYLGVVSAIAILSEALPLYLGGIPCNGVQVESAEIVCVYLAVSVLFIMILTIGASFFIDWPETMGVDPSTMAGAMYVAYAFSVKQSTRFFKKRARNFV
ncbi:hypothetical protein SAMD00023353_1600890 [Rosellinia necatrix]|uniref:Uncharacterized protein n=1 Tax=Rosellinia necatrix TaxID=77044 RepID=A0A1W2TIB5_ROSNE|nr:hypothetical protein SAMD00023353_1600890 [Rosellinia necatrix]